jgi:hypothetical protein
MSLLTPAFAQAITAAAKLRPLLPRQNSDPGSTSCDPWLSIEDSCTAQTPNFLSLAFTVQASCLCYSGTVWQPSVFDNDFDTCLQHLSTASPAAYSSLGGDALPTAPCQVVGNVAGGATATGTTSAAVGGSASQITAQPTATSAQDPNDLACLTWRALQLSCESAVPSFTALPFSVEASCLCFQSSTYIGNVYDDLWGSCLNYFSTASPAFYSSTLGGDTLDRTPCAAEGLSTAASSVVSSAIVLTAGPSATATAPSSTFFETSAASTTTVPTETSKSGASVVGGSESVVVLLAALLAFLFV